jgi:hypothetical protein
MGRVTGRVSRHNHLRRGYGKLEHAVTSVPSRVGGCASILNLKGAVHPTGSATKIKAGNRARRDPFVHVLMPRLSKLQLGRVDQGQNNNSPAPTSLMRQLHKIFLPPLMLLIPLSVFRGSKLSLPHLLIVAVLSFFSKPPIPRNGTRIDQILSSDFDKGLPTRPAIEEV